MNDLIDVIVCDADVETMSILTDHQFTKTVALHLSEDSKSRDNAMRQIRERAESDHVLSTAFERLLSLSTYDEDDDEEYFDAKYS